MKPEIGTAVKWVAANSISSMETQFARLWIPNRDKIVSIVRPSIPWGVRLERSSQFFRSQQTCEENGRNDGETTKVHPPTNETNSPKLTLGIVQIFFEFVNRAVLLADPTQPRRKEVGDDRRAIVSVISDHEGEVIFVDRPRQFAKATGGDSPLMRDDSQPFDFVRWAAV
jgi:hypothetical protein